MAVSAEKRSSRVRRQASKKQPKNRTVQVRFSDEELAALDAVCESTGMTRSAVLRSWTVPGEGAGSNPVYVVTKNADAERLAMEARRIGVNVNQIARTLNAEAKGRGACSAPTPWTGARRASKRCAASCRSWPARWRPCARISGRTCSPR